SACSARSWRYATPGERASRRRRFLELEADLLQTFQRRLAVLVLDFLGEARRVGNRIGLLGGFRHDHYQQTAGDGGDIAETAVLAARHRDHVERIEHQL